MGLDAMIYAADPRRRDLSEVVFFIVRFLFFTSSKFWVSYLSDDLFLFGRPSSSARARKEKQSRGKPFPRTAERSELESPFFRAGMYKVAKFAKRGPSGSVRGEVPARAGRAGAGRARGRVGG